MSAMLMQWPSCPALVYNSAAAASQPDLVVCVQAVGLRSGYHTAIVMGGLYYKVHGMRLAQASEMLLELKAGGLHKGAPPMTHMQLDGEPWQQELPYEEGSPPMHVREVDWSHWNPLLLEQNLCHLALSLADSGSRTRCLVSCDISLSPPGQALCNDVTAHLHRSSR